MNNHFYLVHIRSGETIHEYVIKRATSLDGAANSAMGRARKAGLQSPSIIDVQEKLLTSAQPQLDS